MTQYVGTYRFDARPDRIDLRDRPYVPPLRSLVPQYPLPEEIEHHLPHYLEDGLVLNQGREGACTGFGLACTINYLLWRRSVVQNGGPPPRRVSPRMLYHLARFYDEWPGEDYQGSSCRGAVKAWHKHGVCSDDHWPYCDEKKRVRFIEPRADWEEDAATHPLGVYYRIDNQSLVDMQAAILEVGAIYVSAQVHRGWNLGHDDSEQVSHDSLPEIPWGDDTPTEGGHAFALVGYNARGFIVQNSWGERWGYRGFGVLSYPDWVSNGRDAWVCVLGAPTRRRMDSYFLASSVEREPLLPEPARLEGGHLGRAALAHPYQDPMVHPWDEATAYRHTVVMGNDGRVVSRLVASEDARAAVSTLACTQPAEWFQQLPAGTPPRLVLYAHGGLNNEADSIRRIRTLAPYFKSNGVYPVFFSWRTGLQESLVAIMEDAVGRLFPRSEGLDDLLRDPREALTDVLDRTLEVACENLGVKAIWSQMKQNAEASSRAGNDRGGYLTVRALAELKRRIPTLEIHLVGHSAGSILLGHLLDGFQGAGVTIASCTLLAAACTLDFANRHYRRALDKGNLSRDALHLNMLSDGRERADSVGPYRKSLLYLISRALEDWHKTPLLGMAQAFDPARLDAWSPNTRRHLKAWQGFWGAPRIPPLDREQVVTAATWEDGRIERVLTQIDSAHGAFDNDVEVIDQTLRRILRRDTLEHAVENLRY